MGQALESLAGDTSRRGFLARIGGALTALTAGGLVAKAVMDFTDHIFLVGAGAKKFALEMGFKEQNLLTDQSRRDWMRRSCRKWISFASQRCADRSRSAHFSI